MAVGDFYIQVIAGAIAGLTLIGLLWKHYADKIDKLDETTSQDEFLISSYIWSSNVKNSVKSFVSLMQQNLVTSDPRNEDAYEEIFYDEDRTLSIREKLDSLNKSYDSYLKFNQLLPRSIDEMEKIKDWLAKTWMLCLGILLWGFGYLFLAENALFIYPYSDILWVILSVLLLVTVFCVYKFAIHNKKYSAIKKSLRTEKAKYSSVIRKLT